MIHADGYFKGPRQLDIFYQAWLPDQDVRAVILFVHGMGEHSGRYMNLVNHFIPLGYAVYGLDHIGHGRSQGKREYVETFSEYTQTLTIFQKMVRDRQPNSPFFLLGHSMGGTIAATFLLEYQKDFQGAVFSSPAFKPHGPVSKLTLAGGKILSKILPMAGVLALDLDAICRDPEVVDAYIKDPLTYKGKTPARLAAEMIAAMDRIQLHAGDFHLPMLLVQGDKDTLVDPDGARMIYDRAGSADKHLKLYAGLFHEVFNEPEKQQVLKDVETWLEDHI